MEWTHSATSDVSTLEGDGFWVLFNPHSATNVGPETTLCKNDKYMILTLHGDYRDAYAHLAPRGFEVCKRFYKDRSARPWRSS